MANTLLDIIKTNTGKLASQQAPLEDQTQRAQGLMRARSGRAVGGEAQSNLAEQSAVADTQSQLAQQAQALTTQQATTDIQAREQELAQEQARARVDQARRFDTIENRTKTQSLLNELERDKASLDLEKDGARLEQAAFLLSMQDKQYVDNLQDIGQRRRLDNDAAFRQEQQELIIGNALELLEQKLGNADILSISDADFRRVLADLSLDEARQLADLELDDMRKRSDAGLATVERDYAQRAATSEIQNRLQGMQGLLQGGLTLADRLARNKSAPSSIDSDITWDEV